MVTRGGFFPATRAAHVISAFIVELAAEDVGLARPAAVVDEQEARSNVFDMDGVDPERREREVRQPPAHRLPNLVAELRRVAGPVGRAGHRVRAPCSSAMQCARNFVRSYSETKSSPCRS